MNDDNDSIKFDDLDIFDSFYIVEYNPGFKRAVFKKIDYVLTSEGAWNAVCLNDNVFSHYSPDNIVFSG